MFSSIMKQAFFAYVNHARIRSWNHPVLSSVGKVFLHKETSGAFHGARTHDWQASTDSSQTRYPLPGEMSCISKW